MEVGASMTLTTRGEQTPSISLTGVVAVVNGGTGSTAQNFVDLSTDQSVAGNKTFTGSFLTGNATINQAANNSDLLFGKRFTDSSPTGNLLHFTNQAGGT